MKNTYKNIIKIASRAPKPKYKIGDVIVYQSGSQSYSQEDQKDILEQVSVSQGIVVRANATWYDDSDGSIDWCYNTQESPGEPMSDMIEEEYIFYKI